MQRAKNGDGCKYAEIYQPINIVTVKYKAYKYSDCDIVYLSDCDAEAEFLVIRMQQQI